MVRPSGSPSPDQPQGSGEGASLPAWVATRWELPHFRGGDLSWATRLASEAFAAGDHRGRRSGASRSPRIAFPRVVK